MKMTVDLKEHSYPIYIERGILKEAAERIAEVYRGSKIMIISDDRVYSYYGEALKKNLSEKYECTETVIPHGEPSKAFETLPGVYSSLLEAKISRTDLIVALGGGVVGDLAGFVAATFLRGIKFVQIPTSILAQVDSSVGGKVAVDLPQGKNLVGAFYQPKMVLIDPDVLETLPERYVTDGMGEVIKYGCIKDRKLFELLEKCGSYENLKEHLTDVIATCVDIKRRVVEEDEFDTGERILLNFGHTLAHTIEQHFHYERESHGEAVAIGMYQITKIAEEKGLTKKGEAEHIRKVLEAYKLPVKADVSLPQLTEAIKLDKKTLNNKLKVVLLHEIGDSYTYPTGQEFFDGDRMVYWFYGILVNFCAYAIILFVMSSFLLISTRRSYITNGYYITKIEKR